MIAPTPRGRMSKARRHHIFSENATAPQIAPCCLCGKPIDRHADRWQVEHIRALGLLGRDTNPNCGPAHDDCARKKTVEQDMPRIHKARRQAKAGRKKGRGFWRPENTRFDWKRGRYVAETETT